MQANSLDVFAAIVAHRSSWSQRERDAAEWRAWQCMREDLSLYRPVLEPRPVDEVKALSRMTLEAAKETLKGSEAIARALGLWRQAVTQYEADCAARLQVLANMVWALAEARIRATSPAQVDTALSELGTFIAETWRTDVPLRGDLRAWSSRVTRRYDLLPAGWRELAHGEG